MYITKQEIINLAKENFGEETDQEIWEDYLRKLKTDFRVQVDSLTSLTKQLMLSNNGNEPD